MKTKKKQASARVPTSSVNWQEVDRVLAFMAEHGLEEFDYAHAGVRIHLRKPSTNSAPVMSYGSANVPGAAAGHSSPIHAGAGAPVAPKPEAPAAEDLHLVKSPIVGTFYTAANPQAAPFVKIGDQVTPGQVLCIIEAMKLMNEIEADVAGEVVRVVAENGQPVEYGEVLFAIRTRK